MVLKMLWKNKNKNQEETFEQKYKKERKARRILQIGLPLALFISCLVIAAIPTSYHTTYTFANYQIEHKQTTNQSHDKTSSSIIKTKDE